MILNMQLLHKQAFALSRHLSKRNQDLCLHKNLSISGHSNFTCNTESWKEVQMFFNQYTNREPPHHGIVQSNKKEGNADTRNKSDDSPGNYAQMGAVSERQGDASSW